MTEGCSTIESYTQKTSRVICHSPEVVCLLPPLLSSPLHFIFYFLFSWHWGCGESQLPWLTICFYTVYACVRCFVRLPKISDWVAACVNDGLVLWNSSHSFVWNKKVWLKRKHMNLRGKIHFGGGKQETKTGCNRWQNNIKEKTTTECHRRFPFLCNFQMYFQRSICFCVCNESYVNKINISIRKHIPYYITPVFSFQFYFVSLLCFMKKDQEISFYIDILAATVE